MSLPQARALPPLRWAAWRTRYLFFTGKGGVGKTTTASAVAVALASSGRRTLIVSTDPASNLDEVLGLSAGPEPTDVPGVTGLRVANLEPEAAAAAFRERAVGPYRGVLPDAAIRSMEEQLSGACTVEIAAFDEFTALLAEPCQRDDFDHVVFDTAPTGHTLRLLSLPGAWSGYVHEHPAGASCLGPLAGLDRQREQYAQAVATLADPERTTLVLVSRAEDGALREAARASGELAALGVYNQQLVLNGLLRQPGTDPLAAALFERQAAALDAAPVALAELPVASVELQRSDLTGLDALREMVDSRHPSSAPALDGSPALAGSPPALGDSPPLPGLPPALGDSPALPGLDALVDALDAAGDGVVMTIGKGGVVMTIGKGGVGKTTLAAALAVALVNRGHEVTLSTTDPAAHVADVLAEERPHALVVERIDPELETARYSEEVIAAASGLDAEGRALLAEDLRSPCTQEIAVFRAFARTVDAARERIVVLDTAPTGHTLLLLDAAHSYHREVQRTNAEVPAQVSQLLGRLRDPGFTRMLVVTLAESTPVHEAERLQSDLRRAGIEPFGWIVNASIAAVSTAHPVLRSRAAVELGHIQRVGQLSAGRAWLVGWRSQPPTGWRSLLELAGERSSLAAGAQKCRAPHRRSRARSRSGVEQAPTSRHRQQ